MPLRALRETQGQEGCFVNRFYYTCLICEGTVIRDEPVPDGSHPICRVCRPHFQPTKEELDYFLLGVHMEKGFYCAVDEARRLFHLGHEAAILKVQWVLEQSEPWTPKTRMDPAPNCPKGPS